LQTRWREHARLLRDHKHHCLRLQAVWDHDGGADAFELVVLERVELTVDQNVWRYLSLTDQMNPLRRVERRWNCELQDDGIDVYNPVHRAADYPITVVEWDPATMLPTKKGQRE